MTKPLFSKPKADGIAAGVFLLGLAGVAYSHHWWPNVMIPIGLYIVVRDLLIARYFHALLAFVVFGGIYVTFAFDLSWIPIIFVIAGVYVLFSAIFYGDEEDEEEEEEEIQQELEEKAAEEDKH